MQVELLVLAEGPYRGKVSAVQPAPGRWGRMEGPPRFARVEVDIPLDADPRQGRWDFAAARLCAANGREIPTTAERWVEPLAPLGPDAPPLVAIVGLHRSLSCAFCECLMALGVHFGRPNNRGEFRPLMQLCERLAPFPAVLSDPPADTARALRSIVRAIASSADGRPIGIKYPNLGFLLPELAAAWPSIHWLRMARPLETSIQSLADRAARPGAWPATPDECRHLQTALWASETDFLATRPHHLVDADRLLREPREVLAAAADYLGLEVDAQRLDRAAALIDPPRAAHTQPRTRRPWTDDTTVLVKTFERPQAIARMIDSMHRRYPMARIAVADDSRRPIRRTDCTVWAMPHDSGVSAGRNLLVEKTSTPYLLLCDDDQYFDARFNAQALRDALDANGLDILAAGVKDQSGRDRRFYGHLRIVDRVLRFDGGPRADEEVVRLDVVANCWIGRTAAVRRVLWDPRLKIGEHLDFFYRAWKLGLAVGALRSVVAMDGHPVRPPAFAVGRRRAKRLSQAVMRDHGRRDGFDRVELNVVAGRPAIPLG